MARRLQVEMLVCPVCSLIGRRPNNAESLRGYCVGSIQEGTGHRKARMVPVQFQGQAPEVEKAGIR
jgi:hypothetical protein